MKAFLRSALVQLSGLALFVWGASEHPGYTILVSLWVLWVFTLKQSKPELPPQVIVPPEPPVTTPAPAYDEFGGSESDVVSPGHFSPELLAIARARVEMQSAKTEPQADETGSPSAPPH